MDFLIPSYGLIVVVLILTGAGLPLPEEAPIIYAGAAAAAGKLNVWAALACCFCGALLGDCVLYSIGYRFGRTLAMKHPRFANLLHAQREAQVERWIQRHGLRVLLVARFMVGIRAPVYLAVGMLRMPLRRFVLVDAFCAALVVGFFFALSYRFGEQIYAHIRGFEWVLTVVVAGLAVAVLLWTWNQSASPAGKESSADPPSDEGTSLPDSLSDASSSPSAEEPAQHP